MTVFVVSSEWSGPQAVFYTRDEAIAYKEKVSGGKLMTIRELPLRKKQ